MAASEATLILDDRKVLRVIGAEAQSFLHGLVTAQVGALRPGEAVHAALLKPQGKILYDFHIAHAGEEGMLIDVHQDAAAPLLARLAMYTLRADAQIEDLSAQGAVAWVAAKPQGAPGTVFADPRCASMGWRIIAPRPALHVWAADRPRAERPWWETNRIRAGIAEWGSEYRDDEVFPAEANMDLLGGIDFKKGCFIGQEVVSRMQRRGTVRKRFASVLTDDEAAPLPQGAEITAGRTSLGAVAFAAGARGLALVRLDRWAEALARGDMPVAGNFPVRLDPPDWFPPLPEFGDGDGAENGDAAPHSAAS